ncbi:chain length-determining protein [Duganella sp. FT92W]|uniref:Chain length-determining protein n=1 Tax=Pseudoduganella rivuli TaxID=2666085 RepID=A0A7X2ISH9_9BURK|nr:XrtA system polysaccharide chain length determinant [Pseudoduganella rivuli]MRV75178.1 chain length-determining protein [Pseudoduganella rivuli]
MEELLYQLHTAGHCIWKFRWRTIAVAWICALAGWTGVALLPNDYQTSARVFVDTQGILKPLLSGMTSVPNVEQQVAIMSRTLLSRPNIERVMRMVDLDVRQATPRDHEIRMDELLNRIRIAGTGSYDIYTITYNDRDPRLVRDVVQSLLAIFVEGSFRGKKGESEKAVQFIDAQISAYEEKLQAAEDSVKEFKLRHNAVLPRAGQDYGAQLSQSADALNTARLDLLEAEQAREAIRQQIPAVHLTAPVPPDQPKPVVIDDPEIDARIVAITKTLDTLQLQYTDQHPDVVAARRLLAQLAQRRADSAADPSPAADPGRRYSPMLQQIKVALTEADAKVAAMRARVRELGVRHARLEAQSKAVPELESQLAQLNRDYQINKDNYEKLISKREAAKLSGNLSSTQEMMNFRIIDPPTLPVRPAGPNRFLLNSGVLAVALAAGCLTAVTASRSRPNFDSIRELRDFSGLQVIGVIARHWTPDQLRLRKRSRAYFGAMLGTLLLAYGGVLTHTLVTDGGGLSRALIAP